MTAHPTEPEQWPPPASPATMWVSRTLADGTRVQLRQVRLWGRPELIDAQHQVWCDGCRKLLPVEELSRIDNPHRAGLPNRAHGRLLPMDDDHDDDQGATSHGLPKSW